MIKKSTKGYAVYTSDGKRRLSRWYTSKKLAQKRLAEIEHFKTNKTDKIIPTRREADPTGQAGNRRKAKADISSRIKQAREPVLALLDAIPVRSVTINKVAYEYDLSGSRLLQLQDEIQTIINNLLEINTPEKPARWFFDSYLQPSYSQGTAASAVRMRSLALSANIPVASQLDIQNILLSPAYMRRFELVSARSFKNMRGFAGDAAADLGRILGEGVALGKSPRTIGAEIRRKFEQVEGYRALRIARTEINTAFTKARAEQTKDARDRLGLEVKVMHLSALAPTTRSWHAARHGHIYTVEQQDEWWAKGTNRINCLCSTVEILYLNGKPMQQDIIDKQAARGKAYFSQNPR
jgi:SPP1 gp7 family putative phage head morphogenesis protein